ncbi:MAG: MFS transporter [Deltaproteobacteria bacterium]|nr:MFS transporter [Deltaproteobacteria bacterium]
MLWTLFSVILLDLIGFGILMPILPLLTKAYGASGTTLGLLIAVYAAMQFLCAPLWGKLSDRIGRKPVMLLTIVGGGISFVILGMADSILGLFIGRTLAGICAANIGLATAYIADVTEEKNRAAGMGLIGMAFGVGFIIGPALGGVLSPFGFRVPILVAAGLNGLNAVLAWWILREPARHVSRADELPHAALLARPQLRRFGWWNFLLTMGITQLETVLVLWLADRYFYDGRHIGYILAYTAVIMALVQGGLIRRLRHTAELPIIMLGAAILGVSLLGLPLVHGLALLLLLLGIGSIGRGLCQPMLLSLVSKLATPAERGAVMGTFQAAASLSRVFAPAIAGWLYDRYPLAPFLFGGAVIVWVGVQARLVEGHGKMQNENCKMQSG